MTAEIIHTDPVEDLRGQIQTTLMSSEFRTLRFTTGLDKLQNALSDQNQPPQAIFGELQGYAGMAFRKAQEIGDPESIEALGEKLDGYNRIIKMLTKSEELSGSTSSDFNPNPPNAETQHEEQDGIAASVLQPNVPREVAQEDQPKRLRGRPPGSTNKSPATNTNALPPMSSRK